MEKAEKIKYWWVVTTVRAGRSRCADDGGWSVAMGVVVVGGRRERRMRETDKKKWKRKGTRRGEYCFLII